MTQNNREEKELYDRWRDLCVDKLKQKLKLNIEKRKKNFEDVVTNAARKILRDETLQISEPPDFRISSTITTEALDRMCKTIESWPGVHLSQCKNLPPIFKKYWRIADNWWNRQKGKWFGDLFFWPILNYNLHRYCKKILLNKENKVQYDYLFYIFLSDILHSKVSFKKARPNPLIFDLALEKSPKLQQYFSIAGEQHGVVWEITKNTKKSVKDYAQSWVKAVKERKFNLYTHFTSVNDGILLIQRDVKIKRNSDSHKSASFSYNSDSHNSDKYMESDAAPEDPNKSEQEIFRLKDKCAQLQYALQQQQHQQHMMAAKLTEMQMNQIYKDNIIAQQQQINDAQIIQAMQEIEAMQNNPFIKQEPNHAYDEKQQYEYNYNINQPVFLPQPARYSGSALQPLGNNILPPPLKTSVGQERRQSYHDVLRMKQYFPASESDGATNHSTHTTASHSHTTVVSNMPANMRQSTPTTGTMASTPSGSDVSNHKQFYYPNAISALPSLQIYGNQHNNYHYQAQHYHLPPPLLPPPILQQMPMATGLLPPPPNNRRQSHASHPSLSAHSHHSNCVIPPVHSNNNSFEMGINSQFAVGDNVDNNYNEMIPFDQEINVMDCMDNILNNLSGSNMANNAQMSASNLSLNPNFSLSDQGFDIGFALSGSSNPNFNMNSVNNMSISHNGGMSISNVGIDSDQ